MSARSTPAVATLFMAAAALVAACSSGPSAPDEQSYLQEIAQHRTNIDKAFREQPDEPIPVSLRDKLLPLRYYDVDPAYAVPAALKLSDERPVFEMPTSTGKLRRHERVGVLEFTLQGKPMTLGAFVEEGQSLETLFVPFADLTTGSETYDAGRYLELHPTSTGFYTVDFNRAFNPYCAYNNTYDCPFPPPSNRLKVAIRAGEKAPGA
jgi:uncharacterized protein (DUF1684 family)